MKNLLKSYDLNSYYNVESRFNNHKERLINLLEYIDYSDLDTLWITDYQHSFETKSNWNSNIPFFSKEEHIDDAICFLITQIELRRSFSEFSISDFLFSFFKKEFDYYFIKSDTFNISVFNNNTIVIKIPVNANFNLKDIRIKKYKSKFLTVPKLNKWKYINLQTIFSDYYYNKSLIPSMRADFEAKISKENISTFYSFFKQQNNFTKEINIELCENFLLLVYSALLPKKISSLIYLPTVIIKSNQDEITTGGFSLINFNGKLIKDDIKIYLKLISKNWLSENAIADYLKIIKVNMERDNNAMILHNVKALIKNASYSWEKLKKCNFKSQYYNSELDKSIKKLNKRSDAVLNLRRKIRDVKPLCYSTEFNKKYIVEIINELIKVITPTEETKEDLKQIVSDNLVSNWVNFKSSAKQKILIEDSFEIIISEVLDNALKNNSDDLINNHILIDVSITLENIEIIVKNDEEMPKKQRDYINANFNYNIIEESINKTHKGLGFALIRDCSLLLNIKNSVYIDKEMTYYKLLYGYEKN